ncbi:MAG TPA: polysaccharide ABC transporter ATP-binding protein [Planctomycetota bacterium]|nr:polysaccharide ABC transporter ATP-binding protein [Planctomycetota bacterium]
MSELALSVCELSKQYRIGKRAWYKTFRESLTTVATLPLRKMGIMRDTDEAADSELIWALKDVSFEVKRGEVVGFIGANGAGKSTLLKILSRITEPTEGCARINGRVGSLLEVGTGFHPELTGRENIFLNGAILGMKRAEILRKFDEIVAFSEVGKFIDTPVKHYSSGMYMRLAFSVAAHLDPEILIVDEVLAVGDAHFQKKCMGKMSDVAGQGRTVLFVSHNLNAVEQLCNQAVLMEQGKIRMRSHDVRSVIKAHLNSCMGDSAASEWHFRYETKADPWFQPLHFRITDAAGKSAPMPSGNDLEHWLEIDAEVWLVDPALKVGYVIHADDGTPVYQSFHVDGPEESWPVLSEGRHVFRTRIPPRFLNEGTYRIELVAALHNRQDIFQSGRNAPTIFLTIRGGLSDSPYWMAKRPGILGPVMEWTVQAK